VLLCCSAAGQNIEFNFHKIKFAGPAFPSILFCYKQHCDRSRQRAAMPEDAHCYQYFEKQDQGVSVFNKPKSRNIIPPIPTIRFEL